MRALRFFLGFLLVLVPEILRVFWIMPFPGSQQDLPTDNAQVDQAYFLHNNIWWIRLIGLALMIGPFVYYMRYGGAWERIGVLLPSALCALVFYAFNFKFMADKLFIPPKEKLMQVPVVNDSTANSLVIGVEINGDARAYPIEIIGYHHQVLDTIGGEPVLVTYCTVCRTGRAFSPKVNGAQETFRLVGMDHYNALFEDSRTKSWWRQVNGECIEGPLKGQHLIEVPSQQMTLKEWAAEHPKTLVLQPDPLFSKQYTGLKGYDDGTIEGSLEARDTASWQPKSWVVGMVHNGVARAYDWNDLLDAGVISDTLGGQRIELTLGHNSADFVATRVAVDTSSDRIAYSNMILVGTVDTIVTSIQETSFSIPAYQEFWHSWRTFHPNTTRYVPKR